MAFGYVVGWLLVGLMPSIQGLSTGASNSFKCGTPLKQPASLVSAKEVAVGKRIIGGREAELGSWPWMVMLKKNNESTCGGSIIYKRVVVTAAHCFYGSTDLSIWTAHVGKHHKYTTDSTEMVYTIERVLLHERYNNDTFDNDIALLLLKEPIQYTEYIMPICLPPPRSMLDQSRCFATGWGETIGTGNDDVLKEVRLQKKLSVICAIFLKNLRKSSIRKNVYCAGGKDADACYGDSGGPYSCKSRGRWYLQGIVSSGRYCGQPGWYGIYVRVQKFVPWIKNTLSQKP